VESEKISAPQGAFSFLGREFSEEGYTHTYFTDVIN
jgi:hypothetical protein